MTLTNSGGVITVTAANGTILLTQSAGENWNESLAASVLTDSDGSQQRWDIPSQSFVSAVTLAEAQANQIALLQAEFAALCAAGITATGGGITATLPADTDSQNTYTRFVVLNLAAGTPSTQSETIFDINGAPITNTLANIQALIVAYAVAIKAAQVAMLTKIAQVQAATTVAAVEAIK